VHDAIAENASRQKQPLTITTLHIPMAEYQDIPQALFEQIEAYLSGKMPEAEQAAFAKRLAVEHDLQTEVELVKASIEAIEQESLNAAMNDWHQDSPASSRQNLPWLAMAAGFAVIVAAAWWFLFSEQRTNDALFAQYATIEPGLSVPMSASAAQSYAFYDAMVDYKAEKYELAISKWETQLQTFPSNDTLVYFIGVAHFNDEQFAAAAQRFESVLDIAPSVFADKARLYLMLSWLKTGQSDRIQAFNIPEDAPNSSALLDIAAKTRH
jgi:tetratricopeptide (TPR) repeat protein